MEDPNEVDIDEGTQFIKVSLYDTQFSSTILKATLETVAANLVEAIFNKIEVSTDDQKYYKLVLVLTGASDYSDRSSRHCVRTLGPLELILDIESQLRRKQTLKYRFHTCSSSWYFKDIRTAPLELGEGEITGGGSADEEGETEISLNDLSCLSQSDRCGYLLKRSSTDPNVWQQRYCVLADKLWCVNDRLREPTATCIPLNGSTKLQSKSATLTCPGAIILQSNQGLHTLLCSSASEQQGWMEELALKAALMADNDVIAMAEVIICDEEATRCQRMQRGVTTFLDSAAMRQHLNPWCEGGTDIVHNQNSSSSRHINSTGEDSYRASDFNAPFSSRRFRTHQTLARFFINNMQMNSTSIFEVLTFVNSVHRYNELFRHDLGASPEAQWGAVLHIFYESLAHLFSRLGILIGTSSHLFFPKDSSEVDTADIAGDRSETATRCAMASDDCSASHIADTAHTTPTADTAHTTHNAHTAHTPHNITHGHSYWDSIPPEVIIRLHRAAFSHLRKCEKQSSTIPPKSIDVMSNKEFPRTPSAGGEDSSIRMLFGESSSTLSLAPAALSSTSNSLWSWTTKAFGLSENVPEEDSEGDQNKYEGNETLEERSPRGRGRPISGTSKSSPTDQIHILNGANGVRCAGACIVAGTSPGEQEMFYLKDRNIRPDSSLFHELSEALKVAMGV